MRIVCATHALDAPGGTETYTMTLAAALERLGHDVWLYAWRRGQTAEFARASGLRVPATEHELPDECDAVVANLTDVAYDLAARYPRSAHVYVCHGTMHQINTPPQVPGACDAIVILNDRVGRWAKGLASTVAVTRLSQPVDLDRFHPRGGPRDRPRRLLLFGNYAHGARRSMVEQLCTDLGIDVVRVGAEQGTASPEGAIAEADIVMGYGRCIVEAMAAGRAAYVYDRHGGDGWVTPESYERLESDGFGGQATGLVVDGDRLRADLAGYRPDMGMQNRDLAIRHHAAGRHASAVVELLQGLVAHARSAPDAPWRELARLVRQLWYAEGRSIVLQQQASDLQTRILAQECERDALHAQVGALMGERDAAAATLAAFKATRRYRAAVAMARPVDVARRTLRRR